MTIEYIEPRKATVQITESAENHILQQVLNTDTTVVKLTLKPSGCAGFSYVWDLKDLIEKDEVILYFDKIAIVTNTDSAYYLDGSTIDLETTGMNKILIVNSPKAVHSCGCGESVTFEE